MPYIEVYDSMAFLGYSDVYVYHHNLFQIFITSKRNVIPLSLHSPTPIAPNPRQLFCFLSLEIGLLWTFHINRIMQYVVLCDCFFCITNASTAFSNVSSLSLV